MNLGLSPEFKTIFYNQKKQKKKKKENISNYKYPVLGEACFLVDIFSCKLVPGAVPGTVHQLAPLTTQLSKRNKIGYSVNLKVMISQHARDELLLCSLINYLIAVTL